MLCWYHECYVQVKDLTLFSACVLSCSFSLFLCIQDGHTALHVASQNGHCGITRMLLEAKADVNKKDCVSVASQLVKLFPHLNMLAPLLSATFGCTSMSVCLCVYFLVLGVYRMQCIH